MERPTGPVDPASCATCHTGIKDHAVLHGPVVVNACSACHRVDDVKEHTFSIARQGSALCTHCHDMEIDGAAVIHTPVAEGNCTGCHDPHGGSHRLLLKAPTVDQLCRTCHEDVIGNARHVHGPVAAGACVVCHLPHASAHAGLLRAPGADLCKECHVTIATQLDTMRVVHEPVRDNCQGCHDAHASDHPMMLLDEPQTLCLNCHESIRHTVETATTQHAAVTSDRQCLNCHDAHASDHPRMLLADMKTLCFECHDRELPLPGGGTLANIKAVIEAGTSLHGPVAQDNCAACHMIHGGDNFRMLIREYPPEFYASFAEERYALCFSCHDRQLVYDQRTTSLTDFRNGDLNLHYLHVNRETKGRTCRACHDTHASNNSKHIRESVPFGSGGWKLPIAYEQTVEGGRCAPGCHVPYEYNRIDPVDYEPAETPAVWPANAPAPAKPGADR